MRHRAAVAMCRDGVLYLTTQHPVASYGVPVLWLDGVERLVFGPADTLPDGTEARALVHAWLDGQPAPSGYEWLSDDAVDSGRLGALFLAQEG